MPGAIVIEVEPACAYCRGPTVGAVVKVVASTFMPDVEREVEVPAGWCPSCLRILCGKCHHGLGCTAMPPKCHCRPDGAPVR